MILKDKISLVESLVPLVLPLIRDRAKVNYPIPGNNENAHVNIQYERHNVTLSTDTYEILRLEVLQYFQNILDSSLASFYSSEELNNLIKDKLNVVFLDY